MRAILGGVLGLVVIGCAAGGPSALMDTDKTQMRAATDSFTAYVVMHRDSTAAAMFTDNAVMMPPNHAIVQGRAAIRDFIKSLPPLRHFTAAAIDINGRGDLAYVRGTYQMELTNGAVDAGKYVQILRKESNGRWLTTADIFNSDLPAQTTASK